MYVPKWYLRPQVVYLNDDSKCVSTPITKAKSSQDGSLLAISNRWMMLETAITCSSVSLETSTVWNLSNPKRYSIDTLNLSAILTNAGTEGKRSWFSYADIMDLFTYNRLAYSPWVRFCDMRNSLRFSCNYNS